MSGEDPVARLERAARALEDAEAAIEHADPETVRTAAEAYGEATSLLDGYVDTATGTGGEEFKAYVRFKGEFESLIEDLPDDVPEREAFEAARDAVDKRRLTERDFERAREALSPVAEYERLLEERRTARERYRDARHAAREHARELEDRIEELRDIQDLGTADLDAPVERLREPIEAYNEAVLASFREFRSSASAREVLSFAEDAARYPLVGVREPPADLRAYVRSSDAGTESVPTLLEYADYSRSKLDHYVADAGELKRNVATRQTYLQRLDGSELTIEWPPPPAERLRYRIRELIAVCSRFAPESVIERLREVRERTREEEGYERLRSAAVAADRLGPDERERLAAGEIERELADRREERERVEAALENHPPL